MFWIFKKRFDFLSMLKEQAQKTHETIQALVTFMEAPDLESGKQVEDLEAQADALRRKLIAALNASFITPLDREDIYGLSRAIDNMADYAKTTVEETMLFEVSPKEDLKEMTKALEDGCGLLTEAVSLLAQHGERTHQAIVEVLVKVKKKENYIEKRYRHALKDLFASSDFIAILKTREICRHLSNAADRMDEAANILGDILMKSG